MKLRLNTTTIAIYFLFTILWVTLFTHASCCKKNFEIFNYFKIKTDKNLQLIPNETNENQELIPNETNENQELIPNETNENQELIPNETDENQELITNETNDNQELITKKKDENMQLMKMKEHVLKIILTYLDSQTVFTRMNVLFKRFKIILDGLNLLPQMKQQINMLPENIYIIGKTMMKIVNIYEIDLLRKKLAPAMTVRIRGTTYGVITLDGVLQWNRTFFSEDLFADIPNVKLFKTFGDKVLVLHKSDQSDRTLHHIFDSRNHDNLQLDNVKSIFINPMRSQFIYDGSFYYEGRGISQGVFKKIYSHHIQDEIYKRGGIKEIIPLHVDLKIFGIYFQDHTLMIWEKDEILCDIQNVKQIEYFYFGIVILDESDNIIVFDYELCHKELITKNVSIERNQMKIKVEEIKTTKYCVAARFSNGEVMFWSIDGDLLRQPFRSKCLNTFCKEGVDKIFGTNLDFIALKKSIKNGLIVWNAILGEEMKIYEKDEEKKKLLKEYEIKDMYEKNKDEFMIIFEDKHKEPVTFYHK